MKRIPRIHISEDRYGNINVTNDTDNKSLFFQDESDKEFIVELLKKGERKDLDEGYTVDIKENEPRALVFEEFEWREE